MFENTSSLPMRGLTHTAGASLQAVAGYGGPERRTASSMMMRWLALACDEIGLGLVLVVDHGHVLHLNHTAQSQLCSEHPLQLLGRELRARLARDVAPLHDALAAARRGLRRVITMGQGEEAETVAFVPLAAGTAPGTAAADGVTLVMLSRREVGEALAVQWFARLHGLTQAEALVLDLLCQGLDPREIAQARGVLLATVRTQVGAIRAKTGTRNIRAIMARVARLPPMVGALRGVAVGSGSADAQRERAPLQVA